jgi:serpin B
MMVRDGRQASGVVGGGAPGRSPVMSSHATAHPYSLSRRALLGHAVLGVAAAAGLDPRGARAVPATPVAGVPDLVAGNTAFALDLYAAVRRSDALVPPAGNLLFSPYSLSQALAMTYAGADGETAAQMADVLTFTLPQPALHAALSALNGDLVARGNAQEDSGTGEAARSLRIANALWGEQTYPFNREYMALLARYYGAGLHEADFINASEETRQEINAWVAEQTEDRIRDIVPKGAINSGTRLVLANGIYFYGGWETAFEPDATRDGDFFLREGATAIVPFMVQEVELPYARGDGFQVVELPYAESGFALTVILPDAGSFDAVEAGLDVQMLTMAIGHLDPTEVWVYLPKFEFEFGTISLKQTLQAMGMTDAFDERADFTGMQEEGTPPEPLGIGDVLHKAFISVDEHGTEAAAATVVLMSPVAAPPSEEPIEVRIDRPFIFAIRDMRTGTVLFLGRVMDPRA